MKRITSIVLVSMLLMAMASLNVVSVSAASSTCKEQFPQTYLNMHSMVLTLRGFEQGDVITFSLTSATGTVLSFQLTDKTLVYNGDVPVRFIVPAPASGEMTLILFVGGAGLVNLAISCEAALQPASINDGRLNGADLAAPVVIYSGYDIYAIDPSTSQGQLALHFPAADVPSEKPAAPVLLGEAPNPFTGAKISLYQLPTGELQLNTQDADGKDYVFRWSA